MCLEVATVTDLAQKFGAKRMPWQLFHTLALLAQRWFGLQRILNVLCANVPDAYSVSFLTSRPRDVSSKLECELSSSSCSKPGSGELAHMRCHAFSMGGDSGDRCGTKCICSGVAPYGTMPAAAARANMASSCGLAMVGERERKLMPSKMRT